MQVWVDQHWHQIISTLQGCSYPYQGWLPSPADWLALLYDHCHTTMQADLINWWNCGVIGSCLFQAGYQPCSTITIDKIPWRYRQVKNFHLKWYITKFCDKSASFLPLSTNHQYEGILSSWVLHIGLVEKPMALYRDFRLIGWKSLFSIAVNDPDPAEQGLWVITGQCWCRPN